MIKKNNILDESGVETIPGTTGDSAATKQLLEINLSVNLSK